MPGKKRLHFIAQFILIALLSASAVSAFANGPTCADIFRIRDSKGGVAVEMEVATGWQVYELLVPKGGKVTGLFPGRALPGFYVEWAARIHPEVTPENVPWKEISTEIKTQLLIEMNRLFNVNFNVSRAIPNVEISQKVKLRFLNGTFFMGKFYKAGTYTVDLRPYMGKIEFGQAQAVADMGLVEFHLRSDILTASELVENVRILQAALEIPFSGLHEHIVAPIPEKVKTAPIDVGLEVSEFYQRGNLASELLSVFLGERLLTRVDVVNGQPYTMFGPIRSNFLPGVLNYFIGGLKMLIGSTFKMGWIGFRGSDTYDQAGVYGFEYRNVPEQEANRPKNQITVFFERLIDGLQSAMWTQSYGYNAEQMKDWLRSRGIDPNNIDAVTRFYEGLWYRKQRSLEMTVDMDLPAHLKPLFHEDIERKKSILKKYQDNTAVYMLLHDWSKTFLYYGDAAGVTRMEDAQMKYLKRMFESTDGDTIIMHDFVIESGLFLKVLTSMGIDISDLPNFYVLIH